MFAIYASGDEFRKWTSKRRLSPDWATIAAPPIAPEAYLRDVLARITDHPVIRIDDLLPRSLHGIQLRLNQLLAA